MINLRPRSSIRRGHGSQNQISCANLFFFAIHLGGTGTRGGIRLSQLGESVWHFTKNVQFWRWGVFYINFCVCSNSPVVKLEFCICSNWITSISETEYIHDIFAGIRLLLLPSTVYDKVKVKMIFHSFLRYPVLILSITEMFQKWDCSCLPLICIHQRSFFFLLFFLNAWATVQHSSCWYQSELSSVMQL